MNGLRNGLPNGPIALSETVSGWLGLACSAIGLFTMDNRAFDYGAKFRVVRRDFLGRRTDFLGSSTKGIGAGRQIMGGSILYRAAYKWGADMEATRRGKAIVVARSQLTRIAGWFAKTADPWSKWMQVVAIVGAAWWAIYNYNLLGTSEPTPVMKVSVEVLPYDADKRLLVVHALPHNVGKVSIDVGYPMSITIKRIPEGEGSGYIDRDKLPPLFEAKNIIQRYAGYQLDPGVEFEEVEPFVVPAGASYIVEAVLGLKKDEEVGATQLVHVGAGEMASSTQKRVK